MPPNTQDIVRVLCVGTGNWKHYAALGGVFQKAHVNFFAKWLKRNRTYVYVQKASVAQCICEFLFKFHVILVSPALICLAARYHYTPVFMSNSWWFCVSLTVRNSSHACVRSFDCSLWTKCTISCDLLTSPFNSLVFLSSTAPLPLLITSFFFCPHLERNKN